jgi:acyl-CoA synthetase (AMP-forming)/AMP-acid ligase II
MIAEIKFSCIEYKFNRSTALEPNQLSAPTMTLDDLLARPFGTIQELVAFAAQQKPDHLAIILDTAKSNAPGTVSSLVSITYAALDTQVSRVAASLQRDGLVRGDAVAICADTTIDYVALFLGILRAGGLVVPLPPSASSENLTGMLLNSKAKWLFVDLGVDQAWGLPAGTYPTLRRIALDSSTVAQPWSSWLSENDKPTPVDTQPAWPFNLIYSSGTTGVPKGIMQPCAMRWSHIQRAHLNGYGSDTVLLTATPMYSNTTLPALLPTLGMGGTAVMMAKFDTHRYLELAQRFHVTITILVPVQYQRLMDDPGFDSYDLTAFKAKFSTSAPFAAKLKAEVLKRWPGGLSEVYGMTEGGGRCQLDAHLHPDKLHTIGRPSSGADIRLIDEQGREVARGEAGEIVGNSPAMMEGYYDLPDKTREAEWFDKTGKRFIRTGDIARFDEDGFLILSDRIKDMVISGGFNIYPSDLEGVIDQHPEVKESAVVGVPSRDWGETPVGFVVLKPEARVTTEELRRWVNAKLGKTQRLAGLQFIETLPRSEIGKVLKRQLRETYATK